MREGWRSVSLGSLFEADNQRLGRVPHEPPVFSLSKHDGFVLASDYFDARVASADLQQYKMVPPGGWAYSTIHIDEGSIARNARGELGVISPMYTTLRWRHADHDPSYFALLLRTPPMLAEYRARAQGTVNRRRSLRFAAFAAIAVEVPPLAEQRRIVDLAAALDDARSRSRALARSAAAARSALLELRLSDPSAPRRALRDLSIRGGLIGGPFGSELRTRDYTHEGVPVINGANHSEDDLALRGPFQYLSEQKARSLSRNSAHAGDVVATNQGSVGQVSVVPSGPYAVYVVSQRQLRLRLDADLATPEYVVLALRARDAQAQIAAQTISTAVPHINLAIFGALEIPLPSIDRQVDIAREQAGLIGVAQTAQQLGLQLDQLGRALLADLLSGTHEIPASYDRFIDGAA
jgi:hypothetical protein